MFPCVQCVSAGVVPCVCDGAGGVAIAVVVISQLHVVRNLYWMDQFTLMSYQVVLIQAVSHGSVCSENTGPFLQISSQHTCRIVNSQTQSLHLDFATTAPKTK